MCTDLQAQGWHCITNDCPVALRRAREAYKKCVAVIVGFIAWMGFAMPAFAQDQSDSQARRPTRGSLEVDAAAAGWDITRGDISVGKAEVGELAPDTIELEPADAGVSVSTGCSLTEKEPPNFWFRAALLNGLVLVALLSIKFLSKRANVWMIGATFVVISSLAGLLWSCFG